MRAGCGLGQFSSRASAKPASRFIFCSRGVAAIEFAILLPFLLLLLFGASIVTKAIMHDMQMQYIANDMALLISKEPCIAKNVSPLDNTPTAGCTGYGGRGKLEQIFNSVIPFLLYPDGFNVTNDTAQIEVRFMGVGGVGNCSTHSGLNTLWKDRYPLNAKRAAVSEDNSAQDLASSQTYQQVPFIAVNFADYAPPAMSYPLSQVLPVRFEKTGSFPVRSAWIDGACGNPADSVMQPGELISMMQYCSDCNVTANAPQN